MLSGCLGLVAGTSQAVARRGQQPRLTPNSNRPGLLLLLLLLLLLPTTTTTAPQDAAAATGSTTQHAELSRGAARGDHGAYNTTNSIPAYNNNNNNIISNNNSDSNSNTNSTDPLADGDAEQMLPQIPSYIRTTAMFFCIIIMLLGVIGNVMVSILI